LFHLYNFCSNINTANFYYRKNREIFLKDVARDNTQLLINKLWKVSSGGQLVYFYMFYVEIGLKWDKEAAPTSDLHIGQTGVTGFII
jgi:hypothetical protein